MLLQYCTHVKENQRNFLLNESRIAELNRINSEKKAEYEELCKQVNQEKRQKEKLKSKAENLTKIRGFLQDIVKDHSTSDQDMTGLLSRYRNLIDMLKSLEVEKQMIDQKNHRLKSETLLVEKELTMKTYNLKNQISSMQKNKDVKLSET